VAVGYGTVFVDFCRVFGEKGDHLEIDLERFRVQRFRGSEVQGSAPSALTVFDQAGIKNEHRTSNIERPTSNIE